MVEIPQYNKREFDVCSYQMSEDQWKRRKASEADPAKSGDERQIIRVAQQQQQPPQQQQQQVPNKQQFHSVESISPSEVSTNHYARRFYEATTATTSSGTPTSKSHLSPLDYVKNKIVEVMRTSEDDSATGNSGDRNSSNISGDKDNKCERESPSGGEMVIDESPSQPQQQPPAPAPTTFYPFSALGVHTGHPPPPPPVTSAASSLTKAEQMQAEPAPLLSAQYEPLSDED